MLVIPLILITVIFPPTGLWWPVFFCQHSVTGLYLVLYRNTLRKSFLKLVCSGKYNNYRTTYRFIKKMIIIIYAQLNTILSHFIDRKK